MKIILNDVANKKYLNSYLDFLLQPSHETIDGVFPQINVLNNADVDLSNVSTDEKYVLFAPKSLCNILDKLNAELFAGSTDTETIKQIVETIINGSKLQRDKALTKFINMGLGDESMVYNTRVNASQVTGFLPSEFKKTYDTVENCYSFNYNIPVKLDDKYDQANLSGSDKLCLFFFPKTSIKFGGLTDGYFQTFTNGEGVSPQFSYVMTELGDTNAADADIKYDYLDKIEYIDSFRLRLALPNELK